MISGDSSNPIFDFVPLRYRAARLENLSQGVQLAISEAQGDGLVFTGQTGRGKTYAMAAICNVQGGRGWIDWAEFCLDVRRHWNIKDPTESRKFDPILWAIRVPLLFIDDLGEERDERSPDWLQAVVKGRDDNARPILMTTNLTTDELEKRYGGRVVSRLYGSGGVIEMQGEDRRMRKVTV